MFADEVRGAILNALDSGAGSWRHDSIDAPRIDHVSFNELGTCPPHPLLYLCVTDTSLTTRLHSSHAPVLCSTTGSKSAHQTPLPPLPPPNPAHTLDPPLSLPPTHSHTSPLTRDVPTQYPYSITLRASDRALAVSDELPPDQLGHLGRLVRTARAVRAFRAATVGGSWDDALRVAEEAAQDPNGFTGDGGVSELETGRVQLARFATLVAVREALVAGDGSVALPGPRGDGGGDPASSSSDEVQLSSAASQLRGSGTGGGSAGVLGERQPRDVARLETALAEAKRCWGGSAVPRGPQKLLLQQGDLVLCVRRLWHMGQWSSLHRRAVQLLGLPVFAAAAAAAAAAATAKAAAKGAAPSGSAEAFPGDPSFDSIRSNTGEDAKTGGDGSGARLRVSLDDIDEYDEDDDRATQQGQYDIGSGIERTIEVVRAEIRAACNEAVIQSTYE